MSRPLCEARRSPTRPGPAAPGRAAAAPLAGRDSGFGPAAPCASPPGPLLPLLLGPRRAPSRQRPELPFLVSSSSPRVAAGAGRVTGRPSAFPRLPLTTRPPRACSFLPCSGPAFICLSLSVFFPDDLAAARRRPLLPQRPKGQGNKGKAPLRRWPRAGSDGAGGSRRRAVGRGLGDAPRGKDLSEAAQFAGASRGGFEPFRCVPAAGEQLFSLTTSNS